jgi:hypothetical protein
MGSASSLGNLDDKLDILELNGMSGSATFKITPDSQPGDNMLGFLRLMQLKGKRLVKILRFVRFPSEAVC